MALTAAHPGVIRARRMLWITDPDATKHQKQPQGPPKRGGSIWAYLVVAVVFVPAILLPIYVPWDAQKLLAGWIPGADTEGGFKGLLAVTGVVVLAAIAWIAYGKPYKPDNGIPVRTKVAITVFMDFGVDVNDEMAWKDLWELGHAIERLGDAATGAFEADERGDRPEEARIRSIIAAEMNRVKRASRRLGLEPDLSFFEDAPAG
jgi:hypothetical protein